MSVETVEYYLLSGVYTTPKSIIINFRLQYDLNGEDRLVSLEEDKMDYQGYHDNAGLYIMLYKEVAQLRWLTGDMHFENAVVGYMCRECGFRRFKVNHLAVLRDVLDKNPSFRITSKELRLKVSGFITVYYVCMYIGFCIVILV